MPPPLKPSLLPALASSSRTKNVTWALRPPPQVDTSSQSFGSDQCGKKKANNSSDTTCLIYKYEGLEFKVMLELSFYLLRYNLGTVLQHPASLSQL